MFLSGVQFRFRLDSRLKHAGMTVFGKEISLTQQAAGNRPTEIEMKPYTIPLQLKNLTPRIALLPLQISNVGIRLGIFKRSANIEMRSILPPASA